MDMDPDMAKDVAETRKRMQDMQNMDFMGSCANSSHLSFHEYGLIG